MENDGNYYTYRFDGSSSGSPNNQFVQDFIMAYNYGINNGGGDNLRKAATDPNVTIYLKFNPYSNNHYARGRKPTVFWNSRIGLETRWGCMSPATILEHEIDHAYDDVREGGKYHEAHVRRVKEKDSQYGNKEDRRVVTGSERKTARANGEAVRYNHEGTPFVTISPISTKPLRLR